MDASEYSDDLLPTDDEADYIRSLTDAQVVEIDDALLSHAELQWRKVALIVARTMRQLRDTQPELPDVYYAMRVADLVRRGHLESQGRLQRMRFSEVRLLKKD
jgi:hypothetical protein